MTTKRIVTGAHYGWRDWLGQRVTAVILAVYTVYLLITALSVPKLDYGTWAALFVGPFMKIATLLALLALLYHAWVGIRNVFMDYVKPTFLRLGLQILTILVLFGYAFWTVIILWRV